MSDVFVSYSRANVDFVRQLVNDLSRYQYNVWIDLEGIRFTADWWEEIKRGIENTRNFLLVMSPNSLSSPVCHLEIEYARKLNKRIILLNHIPIQKADAARAMLDRLAGDAYVNTLLGDRNPMNLFDNNWYIIDKYQRVNFSGNSATFQQDFMQLHTALKIDLEHVNLHTVITRRAIEWERSGRNESYLLFGDELQKTETWLRDYYADAQLREAQKQSPKIPAPTDHQIAYVVASRASEDIRLNRLKRIRRVGQLAGAIALFAILFASVAIVLGIQARQSLSDANEQVGSAHIQLTQVAHQIRDANLELTQVAVQVQDSYNQATSSRLVNEAINTLNDPTGNIERATLLGIRALQTAYSPQADLLLGQAMNLYHTEKLFVEHPNSTKQAIYSPSGNLIAYTSWENTLTVRDAKTGDIINVRVGDVNPEIRFAFSPDEQFIVYKTIDNAMRIWNITTDEVITTLINPSSLAYNPDGNYIAIGHEGAIGSGDSVSIWDIRADKISQTFASVNATPLSLQFSGSGKYLTAGLNDGSVVIWDAISGEVMQHRMIHTAEVFKVIYYANDNFLSSRIGDINDLVIASASRNELVIWQVTTGDVWWQKDDILTISGFDANYQALKIAISSANDTIIRIIDLASEETVRILNGHNASIDSIAFNSTAHQLVSSSMDDTVRIWDTTIPSPEPIHADYYRQFNKNGSSFVTVENDSQNNDTIYLWDTATNMQIQSFVGHTNGVYAIAFHPDGQQIASGGNDKTIRIWDIKTGELLHIIPDGHESFIHTLVYSPDGHLLVSSGENSVKVWDAQANQLIQEFSDNEGRVTRIDFSPNNQFLVGSGEEITARIWDVQTGELVFTVNIHTDFFSDVRFSPNGNWLAVASYDDSISIWNTQTWTLDTLLQSYVQGAYTVIGDIAWSHDGRYLAGRTNEHIMIWDMTTHQIVRMVAFYEASPSNLVFSDDNTLLFYGMSQTGILKISVDYRAFIEDACEQVKLDFSPNERTMFNLDNLPTCPDLPQNHNLPFMG